MSLGRCSAKTENVLRVQDAAAIQGVCRVLAPPRSLASAVGQALRQRLGRGDRVGHDREVGWRPGDLGDV